MVFIYIPGGRVYRGQHPALQKTTEETQVYTKCLAVYGTVAQFGLGLVCVADPGRINLFKEKNPTDQIMSPMLMIASVVNFFWILLITCCGANDTKWFDGTGRGGNYFVCYNRLRYFCFLALLTQVVCFLVTAKMLADSIRTYGLTGQKENKDNDYYNHIVALPTVSPWLALILYATMFVILVRSFPSNPEPAVNLRATDPPSTGLRQNRPYILTPVDEHGEENRDDAIQLVPATSCAVEENQRDIEQVL